jgi:hypothetical protein
VDICAASALSVLVLLHMSCGCWHCIALFAPSQCCCSRSLYRAGQGVLISGRWPVPHGRCRHGKCREMVSQWLGRLLKLFMLCLTCWLMTAAWLGSWGTSLCLLAFQKC